MVLNFNVMVLNFNVMVRRVDDDVAGSEDGWTYGLTFHDLDAVRTYVH